MSRIHSLFYRPSNSGNSGIPSTFGGVEQVVMTGEMLGGEVRQ